MAKCQWLYMNKVPIVIHLATWQSTNSRTLHVRQSANRYIKGPKRVCTMFSPPVPPLLTTYSLPHIFPAVVQGTIHAFKPDRDTHYIIKLWLTNSVKQCAPSHHLDP